MRRALLVVVLLSMSVFAADDLIDSKKFEIKKAQPLKGLLYDLHEARIAGLRLQLRTGKKTIKDIYTNAYGEYDFGEVQPGKYQIRMINTTWCRVEVSCAQDVCSIKPQLKVCVQSNFSNAASN